jgi:uncharacterized membrane protein YeaQ/YmgE (transglycosylase-associated protein family)
MIAPMSRRANTLSHRCVKPNSAAACSAGPIHADDCRHRVFHSQRRALSGDKEGNGMSILAWIVLGLLAGFISSKIVNRQGEGIILDIILGIVGAVVGGWIMTALGGQGVNGFNLYSILVAIGGAVVVLVVFHAIRGTSHA